ncbi:MAG: hypothetical protein APG08_00001 [Candidatus Methanofastidiosum methylothiophilum]|nr:MAG: hypothetical protein APG08_00001 [Candidatus Methanofastidiosum methylthiophilus]
MGPEFIKDAFPFICAPLLFSRSRTYNEIFGFFLRLDIVWGDAISANTNLFLSIIDMLPLGDTFGIPFSSDVETKTKCCF